MIDHLNDLNDFVESISSNTFIGTLQYPNTIENKIAFY